MFDYVFNSYHIGKSKRDPSHFDDIANVLGVSPDRILFVDDDPGNFVRARQRGLNALHYIDRDSFLNDLQKILPLQ